MVHFKRFYYMLCLCSCLDILQVNTKLKINKDLTHCIPLVAKKQTFPRKYPGSKYFREASADFKLLLNKIKQNNNNHRMNCYSLLLTEYNTESYSSFLHNDKISLFTSVKTVNGFLPPFNISSYYDGMT